MWWANSHTQSHELHAVSLRFFSLLLFRTQHPSSFLSLSLLEWSTSNNISVSALLLGCNLWSFLYIKWSQIFGNCNDECKIWRETAIAVNLSTLAIRRTKRTKKKSRQRQSPKSTKRVTHSHTHSVYESNILWCISISAVSAKCTFIALTFFSFHKSIFAACPLRLFVVSVVSFVHRCYFFSLPHFSVAFFLFCLGCHESRFSFSQKQPLRFFSRAIKMKWRKIKKKTSHRRCRHLNVISSHFNRTVNPCLNFK